jgi:hypothetical protein
MLTNEEILAHAKKVAIGMSKNQIENYVVSSHVTGDRQLKQVLLEIENRTHQREKMLIDERRGALRLKQTKKVLDDAKVDGDPFLIEEAQIEFDDATLDMEMWSRRKAQSDYELNVFIEHIQNHIESKEKLEEASEWNEDEERKYWIARLGKQAALDIVANGRIGIGNMDSIAMMKKDDQIATLDVASQYSCLLKVSIDKIQGRTERQFKAYAESPEIDLPTFHGVEKTLNVPLLDEINERYLQSSD